MIRSRKLLQLDQNIIKQEGNSGFSFKKINLGLDFQDKTLLDYN